MDFTNSCSAKKENTAVRLCIDMRSANTAIRRVQHPISTIDELIHDFNGSQYFLSWISQMSSISFLYILTAIIS